MASAFLHDNENNKTEPLPLWSSSLCLSSRAHSRSCAEPLPSPPPGGSLDSPSPCHPRPSYHHHLQGVFSWGLPPSPWEGLLWRHSALFYKPFIVLVISIVQHTPQCWSCGLDGSSPWKCKVIGLGLDLSRWRQWDCVGASQRWTPCWYLEKLEETHIILVTVKIALIERVSKS